MHTSTDVRNDKQLKEERSRFFKNDRTIDAAKIEVKSYSANRAEGRTKIKVEVCIDICDDDMKMEDPTTAPDGTALPEEDMQMVGERIAQTIIDAMKQQTGLTEHDADVENTPAAAIVGDQNTELPLAVRSYQNRLRIALAKGSIQ